MKIDYEVVDLYENEKIQVQNFMTEVEDKGNAWGIILSYNGS